MRVVIAGGGTAGWIAATALARQLGRLLSITLVESESIGTIGVGEATIPTARAFHEFLRIDEQAFLAATNATFKLGISFENWARTGDRYFHSFGTAPLHTWAADFQHFWLEARAAGAAGPLSDYYAEWQAADRGRFAVGGAQPLNYAYHLDAGAYARFLRRIAESDGVRRVEGKIAQVDQDSESGDITALRLETGERIEGDLFIDCTGFRAMLIGETMGAGHIDWGHWLLNDSAMAMQTENIAAPAPYTRAIAHTAGWQWRIPLQHRMGNGIVYASRFMPDEDARATLMETVDGTPLMEPRPIRFTAGRRTQAWVGNCVAMGLSSGFLEPLESTSIHLFMIGVTRLIQQFPFTGITPAVRARYNQMAETEMERIRDFIILHYALTEREDSPYWHHCRTMTLPDSLSERISLFAEGAQAYQGPEDLFRVDSWVQVMLGQRLEPRAWHQLPRLMAPGRLRDTLATIAQQVTATVDALPTHDAFIAHYCKGQQDAR